MRIRCRSFRLTLDGGCEDPANGYVNVAFPVEDAMEISSWAASPVTNDHP